MLDDSNISLLRPPVLTIRNAQPRDLPAGAGESPIAVLTAEIALLHARLDDLQTRLDRD